MEGIQNRDFGIQNIALVMPDLGPGIKRRNT
jgi:hypothetical protein